MNTRQAGSRWFLPLVLIGCSVLVLVCVVAVSAVAGWRLFLQNSEVLQGKETQPETTELMTEEPSIAPTLTLESRDESQSEDGPTGAQADLNTNQITSRRGLVELGSGQGDWTPAADNVVIQEGNRIRTGVFSSATLFLADRSEVHLGPQVEVSIDKLESSPDDARRIVFTQWSGEGTYQVAAWPGNRSKFEVRTPAGVIAAQQARFRVIVGSSSQGRVVVDQGDVEITHLDDANLVAAGQTASAGKDMALTGPFFHIEGQGRVTRVGASWRIAGSIYQTYAGTVTTGSPQVGDWVGFKAYVLNDGTRIVYQVGLIERVQKDHFELRGIVDSTSAGEWRVAKLSVQVDESTWVDSEIQPGEYVSVFGSLLVDGTLNATRIQPYIDRTVMNFELAGVVQAITDQEWTVSDAPVRVDSETRIDPGAAVGRVARVLGRVGENGAWRAESIYLADTAAAKFSFAGKVDDIDPWIVAGRRFDAALDAQIDPWVQPGDLVRIDGSVGPGGVWSANRVQLLSEVGPAEFEVWGLVRNTDPWDVGGVQLDLDDPIRIEGKTAVSRLVHVRGSVTEGHYLAVEILGVDTRQGCLNLTSAIRRIRSNRITLFNMQDIPTGGGTLIQGELKTAAVVLVSGCIDENGKFSASRVVVLYQLEELPPLQDPNR